MYSKVKEIRPIDKLYSNNRDLELRESFRKLIDCGIRLPEAWAPFEP